MTVYLQLSTGLHFQMVVSQNYPAQDIPNVRQFTSYRCFGFCLSFSRFLNLCTPCAVFNAIRMKFSEMRLIAALHFISESLEHSLVFWKGTCL